MILAARSLGFAATAAVLLSLGATATPASAQAACKDERIRAKSEIRVRGETFATNEARERWEKAAEERFGRSYGKWSNAKDANVECEFASRPEWACLRRSARHTAVRASATTRLRSWRSGKPTRAASGASPGNRDKKRYSDQLGVREDRHGRRPRTAYDAEMRYQDYLAKRRRQHEKWAERREEAYWRNLYWRWSHGWD